jgi:hypothetical protein
MMPAMLRHPSANVVAAEMMAVIKNIATVLFDPFMENSLVS